MNTSNPVPAHDSYASHFEPATVSVQGGITLPHTGDTKAPTVRVLHLINGEHYSGAERVQDLLALHLPRYGFDVTFACLKTGRFPSHRLAQEAPLLDVKMHSRRSVTIAWQLAKYVRQQSIPLLHSHTPRTALIGSIVSRLTGRPLLHHVHSPTSRDSTRYLHNLINTWVESFSMRQASRLITVSASLRDWVGQQGFRREKIQVVPNGVPAASSVRSAVPPRGTWTLGCVALFRPRKGLEVLIEALAELRKADLDVRLRAVGPFENQDYERMIRQLACDRRVEDHIDWVGFTDQVGEQIAGMDLFILPSLFGEGLPMVILEAMAAGVPIVASRVEGIPEAVRADVDGILVAPDDAMALAAGICRVMDGDVDWQLLRKNALARHHQHFSAETMAARVSKIYQEVLSIRGQEITLT